ncbi:MAG: chromosome segregation protein SMC [Candidatus Aenigmatarchaeota archaeon]|nr:MAG: chromosome segregation protein SMC [Candidatus Aenigmarchaeota archaeon]
MVRIEKVVLEGFKSFKRKASIPFPEGFSVVTGPNGVGKTNIADALHFVLGSGASKSLRAKKAHEVIFQGNAKKKPSEYAKVSMYLNNTDRTIPIDEDSVSVTRRVNKAGVSTYRIAGRISTKQEVMDILSQASIMLDAHNMIQQGDVTRMIEMNPVERRRFIDEIAGITEYDEKKEKAMRELEKVADKVREAEIVLEQKDELMQKIKTERDTALEYRRLQNTLRLVVAAGILRNLRALEKKLDGSEKGSTGKEEEIEGLTKEINDVEHEITGLEKEMDGITEKVLQASSLMEEAGRVSELQARIEMKKERIKMNQNEIARISDMIESMSSLDRRESPAVKAVLDRPGVEGTFADLVMVPPNYKVAVEVAAGPHLADVVVEKNEQAVECIKYLKANRIGRARFIPMDRIAGKARPDLPKGAIGWLSDLVHHDPKYGMVVNFVLGSTVCAKDISTAKEITDKSGRYRIVTLDGDIIEKSGAMTGGYYKKKGEGPNITQYLDNRKNLERESETLRMDLEELEKELKSLKGREGNVESITRLEERRKEISRRAEKLRLRKDRLFEKRTAVQEESGRINVRQARYEAAIETARMDWEKYREMEHDIEESGLLSSSVTELDEKKEQVMTRMDEIGPVNLKAIEEFETFREDFEEFKEKVDKVLEEKNSIEGTITSIEEKKKEVFSLTMNTISRHFRETYAELTDGDADLKLGNPDDLDSGLMIYASPPGKRLLSIDSLSGGEKTITAFAFLFAIQSHKPAPFYVLDESDAALDRANTKRVVDLIKRHSKLAQFILISHNDQLIKEADQVYGVSMEHGESKIIGIQLPNN